MKSLISLCLQNNDVTPLMDFPQELLSDGEREIVHFVLQFFSKHGTAPTTKRVEDECPQFFPVVFSEPSRWPLADVRQLVIDRKLRHYWLNKLEAATAEVRKAEDEGTKVPLPIAELSSLLQLTALSSGMTTFSGFGRDTYFREPGLEVGFKLVDQASGGVGKGETMIIAGRLGHKKTTVALFIAMNWWRAGKRILMVSNEMAAGDIYSRLDGMVGNFNPLLIRSGNRAEVEKLVQNAVKVIKSATHGGEIFVPQRRATTPAEVFALAQNLAVDAVVIDGLYLMRPNGGGTGTAKWERVSEISNQIKQGAMDSELPVIAVTQTKRVGGRKDEYDPEDLAYSDSIGQDADFVMFVSPSVIEKDKVELQLVKNRFGSPISTIASIDFDKMTIVEESIKSTELDPDEWFTKPPKET